MERLQITPKQLDETWALVEAHLDYNRDRKGNGIYISDHEALGIITEEFWEYVEEVRKNVSRLDGGSGVEAELQDIITACIWALASRRAIADYNRTRALTQPAL